jgi:hypothetical protein
MQSGPVPIDRLEISSRRGHLNVVFGRTVEGPIAPNTEVDVGRTDQRFDLRLDHMRRRCDARNIGGQAVALIGIEDRKALQEWNRLGFITRHTRPLHLLGGHEAVSIDNGRTALAFADAATERHCLAEGEPALA